MRIRFLFLIFAIFFALGNAAWESIGPYGGNIRTVLVSFTNDNIAYVSSYTSPSVIAKTTNGGTSWTNVGSISNYIYCGAIDPTNHDKLYMGGSSYFYRSTNGGMTWSSTYTANTVIYGMAVHRTNPAIVYAAGYAYDGTRYRVSFFKSTDGGVNWSTTYLSDSSGYGYCIAIDYTNPNTVYVGGYTYYNGNYMPPIYKTTNAGSSWTLVTSGIPSTAYYIYSLAVHPTNSNIVYAGAYSGIYRSTNGGSSWTQVSTHYYNYGMSVSSAAPNVVYAGGYNDLYKTTDAGVTWAACTTGISGNYFYYIPMSQTSSQIAYLGGSKGVYKTTNAGSNWFNSNTGLCLGSICSFSNAPSSPATVYTSIEGVGVYKTTNNGTVWILLPTPVSCGNICEFAVHNNSPNILYALEGSG